MPKCNRFTMELRPTFAEFDYMLNMKPASVLNYFQEVAGEHANQNEVGRDHLWKRGIFWVLSKVYYRVIVPPKYGERITVATWPFPPGRLICDRDYLIKGENGGRIEGTSKWCLLEVGSHKLVSMKDFDYGIETYYADRSLCEEPGKILVSERAEKVATMRPLNVDLDYNYHVNNAKYGDYVLNALRPEEVERRPIKALQINYLHECRREDEFDVYREDTENGCVLEARASQPIFRAKIEF